MRQNDAKSCFFASQGIFSSVIKDFTGGKDKHVPLMVTEDSKETIQELSVIFSDENFPCDVDNKDNLTVDEDELELNIGMKVPNKCATEYIAFNQATEKLSFVLMNLWSIFIGGSQ